MIRFLNEHADCHASTGMHVMRLFFNRIPFFLSGTNLKNYILGCIPNSDPRFFDWHMSSLLCLTFTQNRRKKMLLFQNIKCKTRSRERRIESGYIAGRVCFFTSDWTGIS